MLSLCSLACSLCLRPSVCRLRLSLSRSPCRPIPRSWYVSSNGQLRACFIGWYLVVLLLQDAVKDRDVSTTTQSFIKDLARKLESPENVNMIWPDGDDDQRVAILESMYVIG